MTAAAGFICFTSIGSASEKTMSPKESTKFITYIGVLLMHTEAGSFTLKEGKVGLRAIETKNMNEIWSCRNLT